MCYQMRATGHVCWAHGSGHVVLGTGLDSRYAFLING